MVAAEMFLEPASFLLELCQGLGQQLLDFRVLRLQPVPSYDPIGQCAQCFYLQ